MLPLKLVIFDWRRHYLSSILVVLLVSVTLCLSIIMTLQERGFRLGTARASEQFDILIGASGSETQLVLSSIFLQPSPLPLLSEHHYSEIINNPLIDWAAPLAFGDYYKQSPIIGTTSTFITLGDQRTLQSGRVFHYLNEAVVGAASGLKIGETFKPLHGQFQSENAHQHDEALYTVVGILPNTYSVWDRAILVPIQSIWKMHHIGEQANSSGKSIVSQDDGDHINSTENKELIETSQQGPVSVVVIKPKTISGAYKIRDEYKKQNLSALFPAEVLVKLYTLLGNANQFMQWFSLGVQFLVGFTILIIIAMQMRQRKQELATLRALGAPKLSLCLLVWLGVLGLVLIGIALGTISGWWLSKWIAHSINVKSGFTLIIKWQESDFKLLLSVLFLSSLIAIVPAVLAYRQSPEKLLKSMH